VNFYVGDAIKALQQAETIDGTTGAGQSHNNFHENFSVCADKLAGCESGAVPILEQK
jgi:hypothetical protein